MFCTKCGKQIPDDADSCNFCGVPVEIARAADSPTTQSPASVVGEERMPGESRTSGLAIASLVLGILGLVSMGLTALVGLVLGIVGMLQIRKSRGRLRGDGLAIAGIAVSSCVILILPAMLAAILFPVFARAREAARTSACQSNLKQLALAVQMYSSDYDSTLPSANQWCDVLHHHVMNPSAYQCPSLPSERCGYAYNEEIGGRSKAFYDSPADVVVLFDATGGWNLAGGWSLADKRHADRLNVAYLDGGVKRLESLEMPPAGKL